MEGFKYTIDTKGTVIFTLSGGGVIRDDGKEVLFSGRNQEAQGVAKLYAEAKWGRNISIENNTLSKGGQKIQHETGR